MLESKFNEFGYNPSYPLYYDDLVENNKDLIGFGYTKNAITRIYCDDSGEVSNDLPQNDIENLQNKPLQFLISSGKHWVAATLMQKNGQYYLIAMDSTQPGNTTSFAHNNIQLIEALKNEPNNFNKILEQSKLSDDVKDEIQNLLQENKQDKIIGNLGVGSWLIPAEIQVTIDNFASQDNINEAMELSAKYSYSDSDQTGLFPAFLSYLKKQLNGVNIELIDTSVDNQQFAEACGILAYKNLEAISKAITQIQDMSNLNEVRNKIKDNLFFRVEKVNDKYNLFFADGSKLLDKSEPEMIYYRYSALVEAANKAIKPPSQIISDHVTNGQSDNTALLLEKNNANSIVGLVQQNNKPSAQASKADNYVRELQEDINTKPRKIIIALSAAYELNLIQKFAIRLILLNNNRFFKMLGRLIFVFMPNEKSTTITKSYQEFLNLSKNLEKSNNQKHTIKL
jgi:hypothetical protein